MIKSTSAKSRLTLSCGVAALTAALALGAPALAQDSTVGEVVVTAQKLSENLQDVPLSVASRHHRIASSPSPVLPTPKVAVATESRLSR